MSQVRCVLSLQVLNGYLRKKNYGYSIMKDVAFEKARAALKSKQKGNFTLYLPYTRHS